MAKFLYLGIPILVVVLVLYALTVQFVFGYFQYSPPMKRLQANLENFDREYASYCSLQGLDRKACVGSARRLFSLELDGLYLQKNDPIWPLHESFRLARITAEKSGYWDLNVDAPTDELRFTIRAVPKRFLPNPIVIFYPIYEYEQNEQGELKLCLRYGPVEPVPESSPSPTPAGGPG